MCFYSIVGYNHLVMLSPEELHTQPPFSLSLSLCLSVSVSVSLCLCLSLSLSVSLCLSLSLSLRLPVTECLSSRCTPILYHAGTFAPGIQIAKTRQRRTQPNWNNYYVTMGALLSRSDTGPKSLHISTLNRLILFLSKSFSGIYFFYLN